MSPQLWQKIECVFNETIALPASERAAFLSAACGTDEQLHREVNALLAHKSSEQNFFDQPAWESAEDAVNDHATQAAISPGTQLGPYNIESRLGRGGMSEVFLAQDTRLGRLVAIKVLPGAAASDPSRNSRLLQEARAASALNHPNIITVHDICKESGIDFLVLEYVPGNSLNELLRPGSLPLADALLYIAQAAAGLAAAHAAGIVHRDIKPGNIMITPLKQVKVLDFGIAKLNRALQKGTGEAPTQTLHRAVMGTVAYMSPEQTRGGEIDARSDLFSLCVVLYEAVTGRLPFYGDSVLSLMEAIKTDQPAKASVVNKSLPKSLDLILSRGLAKNCAERFQSADEFADALRKLTRSKSDDRLPRFSIGIYVAAVGVALGLIGLWTWQRQVVTPDRTVRVEQITNFVASRGDAAPRGVGSPALSRDGKLLAFIHDSQVWIKSFPTGEPTQLTRDSLPKFDPAFSPDGSRITYSTISRESSWDTWVVPTFRAGEPRLWMPNASGLSWTGPDTVLFSEIKSGMHMAVVATNTKRRPSRDIYVPADSRGMAHQSYLSPDRKWVLLTEMDRGSWLPCRVVPVDGSSSGTRVGPMKSQCTHATWSPDGRWIYMTSNASGEPQIWRQAFPSGVPQQLTFGPSTAEGIAVAPDGLSFVTYIGLVQHAISIHDERGERVITTQGDSILPAWGDGFPTSIFSPDGSRLYYLLHSGATHAFGGGELWVHDFAKDINEAVLTGLTVTSFDISPDGQSIVYSALDRTSVPRLWIGRFDRRSMPRRIFSGEARGPVFGRGAEVYFVAPEGRQSFVFALNLDTGTVRKLIAEPSIDAPAVSPDRKWVVMTVPFSGRGSSSLVKAFPADGGVPAVVCQRCFLKWSGDQKALYVLFRPGNSTGLGETLRIPLNGRDAFPRLPDTGLTFESGQKIPGAKIILGTALFPGIHESRYAYVNSLSTENVFRGTLPR